MEYTTGPAQGIRGEEAREEHDQSGSVPLQGDGYQVRCHFQASGLPTWMMSYKIFKYKGKGNYLDGGGGQVELVKLSLLLWHKATTAQEMNFKDHSITLKKPPHCIYTKYLLETKSSS